ncbi:MAG: alpha-amylase family glycosyl hydrolase, partial [Bacteroidia bacterium]
ILFRKLNNCKLDVSTIFYFLKIQTPYSFYASRFANTLLILCLFSTFFISAQSNYSTDWWKKTTVYQIYPRSFYDSNSDGVGDLNGIIQKLDYIKGLGFETIWISPFFLSPQKDFGYDIKDYYSIAPEYGDTTICKQLINEVHAKGMKIIFDLVLNHTSNEHEWFKLSSTSKSNSKADWYVWRDGTGRKGKRKPNNWKSMVGGSGWHYNEDRKQFYWASFLPFQPDLNYHNAEVKKEMLRVADYWINKGVDGYRLDIFNAIYEDTSFTNNPFSFRILPNEHNPNGFFQQPKYTIDNPKSFEFATELSAVVSKKESNFLVGEVFGKPATLKKYCFSNNKQGLNTVFLFRTLNTPLKVNAYKKLITDFERNFSAPFIPTYVYSNHDRKRSISRLNNNVDKAKLLALLQFTVRGIPFMYYGEELGMPQTYIPLKKGKDPMAQRLKWIPQFIANRSKEAINRDGCRTPMLWNKNKLAGFTTASESWLPISEVADKLCVETQEADSNSLLMFYKQIIALRNSSKALNLGALEIAEKYCTKHVLAYYRIYNTEKYLVLLNMSSKVIPVELPEGEKVLMLNTTDGFYLKGYGGVVLKMK